MVLLPLLLLKKKQKLCDDAFNEMKRVSQSQTNECVRMRNNIIECLHTEMNGENGGERIELLVFHLFSVN